MPLATRNITQAKTSAKKTNVLNVIIPAAGMGHRMKSYGPKALLTLYERTSLIERQIEIIWYVYPKSEIFIVVGFGAEKIRERLKDYPIHFIYNPLHATTNVLYSIGLATQAIVGEEMILIYGDLIFNEHAIRNLKGSSKVVIDDRGFMDGDEVGLVTEGKNVHNFSFGLETKWCQIAYLTGKEFKLFKESSLKDSTSQWFGYEALNYVLENGGEIEFVNPKLMKIFEVDAAKDLQKMPKTKLTFG